MTGIRDEFVENVAKAYNKKKERIGMTKEEEKKRVLSALEVLENLKAEIYKAGEIAFLSSVLRVIESGRVWEGVNAIKSRLILLDHCEIKNTSLEDLVEELSTTSPPDGVA